MLGNSKKLLVAKYELTAIPETNSLQRGLVLDVIVGFVKWRHR